MLKRFFALVLGFITGFVLVTLVQMISAKMYPPPVDMIAQDAEALESYFLSLPINARYIVTLAHIMGAFGGAYVAAKFADKYKFYMGCIVGIIILVASVSYNLASFCPGWIVVLDLLLSALTVFIASKLGAKTN